MSTSPDALRLRAQLASYRHLTRGVAPPPATWKRTQPASLGVVPASSDALLRAERQADERVVLRMQARQAELRDVPVDLPPAIRVPLAIERQLPSLLSMQRTVRAEVASVCDRSRMLEEATASLALRRPRR